MEEHDAVAVARQALRDAGGPEAAIAALESALAERLSEAARAFGERETALTGALAGAVAAYRSRALASEPTLPPELVTGTTIAEVDAAVERARETVAKVRQSIMAEVAGSVPAGAPGRLPVDTASLSAREKIAYGVRGN